MTSTAVKRTVIVVGVIALLVAASLALPLQRWRTGETPLPSLQYLPQIGPAVQASRVWVDADAACGTGKQRDPDDCIALLSLATAKGFRIVGVSTVFGNAPLLETDAVMRELIGEIGRHAGHASPAIPVFLGCGAAARRCLDLGGSQAAQAALALALRAGSLDYVALGPLTNLAAVLMQEPELGQRVTRIVAVMGRRPGHRFHPSENQGLGAMLFGHGPIFRDLNAVLDPDAVSVVLQSGIPLVLLPYSAARQVSMTGSDLDALARTMPAGQWVANRSREWLAFWRSEVGLDGFYPFDLMAAAYLREPASFRCARVNAWVGEDALMPWFGGGPALLVSQTARPARARPDGGAALYCDVVNGAVDAFSR